MENEDKTPQSLGKKVDRLLEVVDKDDKRNKKPKRFRLPFKARLNPGKLRQGYVTVVSLGENNAVSFTRELIVDSTIKMGDTYHAVSSEHLLTYKGKPLLIIPKKSLNPYNPNLTENKTFGQKHIMSRMMNEVIGIKNKMGMLGMSVGGLILGGVALWAFIAG